jgi:hypothetical protein
MRAPNKRIKVKIDQNDVTFPCTRSEETKLCFLGGSLSILTVTPDLFIIIIIIILHIYTTQFLLLFLDIFKSIFNLKKYKINIF